MAISLLLNDILGYGLDIAEACWLALSVLCLLGLGFILLGHRLGIPGQMLINRAIFYFMATILACSAVFLVLFLYATAKERDMGFGLIIFFLTMIIPIALSMVGVLLSRYSRFPIYVGQPPEKREPSL